VELATPPRAAQRHNHPMSRHLVCQPGQRLGPYTLRVYIDSGGNAEVWQADAPTGDSVAVKVLRRHDPTSEPYRRFIREVDQLAKLGDFPGVLPILDANVPADPSKNTRAWLAMPIAEPVTQALGDGPPLAQVVSVAAAVAETLARLAERGISHRDVKPSNLYHHQGRWLVGDFGLVKAPDVEPLTAGATALGPRHFLAPEMLNDPATAAGEPADVYSLAKTLWVLATGQVIPPPGEHRLDEPSLRLSAFVAHPDAVYLDRLIERATRTNPSRRPTMRQVADELTAWATPSATVATPHDVSTIGSRIAAVIEPTQRAQQARVERLRLGVEALAAFTEATHEVTEALRNSGVPVIQSLHEEPAIVELLLRDWMILRVEWASGQCVIVGRDPGPPAAFEPLRAPLGIRSDPMMLFTGFGLKVTAEEEAFLAAGHAIGQNLEVLRPVWQAHERVPLGSAQQNQAIARLSTGLSDHLPEALEHLLRALHRAT
jgi:hypothetical protein